MAVVATLVAAPRRALTTVPRLRAEVGGLGRGDDQLEILIQRVSAQVERYCGRVFARETVREQVDAVRSGGFALERTPVLAVASVGFDGQATLSASGWQLANPVSGVLRLLEAADLDWPFGGASGVYGVDWEGGGNGVSYGYRRPVRRRLLVEYTGGFQVPLPDGSVPVDLPADVEGATIQAVRAYAERTDRAADAQSERMGDYSVSYHAGTQGSAAGFPANVAAMLSPWSRLAV